jgi:hypothetical protein
MAKASTALAKTAAPVVQTANHHEVWDSAYRLEGLGRGEYTLVAVASAVCGTTRMPWMPI